MAPFAPNFSQQFFSMNAGQGEARRITSPAVPLRILPFPAGAPASFNGAAGNFTLSADLRPKEAKTGEALNLSITVAGNGNLKAITAPRLPEMPDFKVYDTMSSLSISKAGDIIGGKKVFTTILIPKTAGRLLIPAVKFSFFDPAARVYKELSAGPFQLLVAKGDGDGKNFSFAPGGQPSAITPLSSDIRYVRESARAPFSVSAAGLAASLPLWPNFFPAAFVLLCLWLARLDDLRRKNPLYFRFKKAHGEARGGIEKAEKALAADKPGEAASLLYDSLLAYLHGKSGQKVSGMTLKRTLSLLREKFPGAGDYALGEIKDLWERLEALHFSPAGVARDEAREMLEKYSALLPLLEKEFQKKK